MSVGSDEYIGNRFGTSPTTTTANMELSGMFYDALESLGLFLEGKLYRMFKILLRNWNSNLRTMMTFVVFALPSSQILRNTCFSEFG